MPISSVNPFNSEVLGEFSEYKDKKIEHALQIAENTFKDWSKTSFANRRELMINCADILEHKIEELSEIITLEMGKIISESRAEIKKCAWVCRYYADHGESFLKNEKLDVEEADSYLVYDPLGIVLAIMPWNFPFWQVFRFAAPGLMSGNVGILKHASNVPQCALAIEEVFKGAGFPEGAFQSLLIGSDKAIKLIEKSLGNSIDEIFQSVETEALASASVAQVHAGILKDGTEIVVKVLRPDILPIIKRDIGILYTVAEWDCHCPCLKDTVIANHVFKAVF